MINHQTIRKSFLDFFVSKGHVIFPSASLVPEINSDLLFTNAGMNPFKDIFLGLQSYEHQRVCNFQKCLRVSGKHNDLEEVGFDTYHHTFFEMLGNWSFGDYWKEEAIIWAWELLTKEWGLDKKKLYVTIYKDDDESFEIWKKATDIGANQILRFGEKDNFWEMGRSGPCGPCSEIHIDLGEHLGASSTPLINANSNRFVEIWNLVFIQYYRKEDGTLEKLNQNYVDTGMGLERITSVLQNKDSNYETDLFVPIIACVEKASQKSYRDLSSSVAMRVLSDHMRSICFSIADGIIPSNEGRGYVIRRLLRRASRYSRNIGITKVWLHSLVGVICREFGAYYKNLLESQAFIEKIVALEEETFHKTLDRGLSLFNGFTEKLKQQNKKSLSSKDAFKLYDTYGFPLDLTLLLAKEQNIGVDEKGFSEEMTLQKERSKKNKETLSKTLALHLRSVETKTNYLGAEEGDFNDFFCQAKLLAIFKQEEKVTSLSLNESSLLVFNQSVFYAQSGGQIGDSGWVVSSVNEEDFRSFLNQKKDFTQTDFSSNQFKCLIAISHVKKIENCYFHEAQLIFGEAKIGNSYFLIRNETKRDLIRKNHTATHLLHRVLRQQLGLHVSQKGSFINEDGLRFDFNHFEAISKTALNTIEKMVYEAICHHDDVVIEEMTKEESEKKKAMAFFEEKYGKKVRVVNIGKGYSVELCGGSHVSNTLEIGFFKILDESSSASGIRRIKAITGKKVYEYYQQKESFVLEIKKLLGISSSETLLSQIKALINNNKHYEKESEKTTLFQVKTALQALKGESLNQVLFFYHEFQKVPVKILREQIDFLKSKNKKAVILFSLKESEKLIFLCGISKQLTSFVKAGNLVKQAAKICGGNGGGRDDFAQAGAPNKEFLKKALTKVKEILKAI